jgi:class 3 adenylate cyclase
MAIDLAASVFDSRSKESRVVLQSVTEIVQTNVYRL